ARVSFADEALEIVGGSVLRINRVVVADRVRRADGSFLAFLSHGVDGHQPEDIHAKLLEFVETSGDAVESSFRRELTCVNLINDAVARPIDDRAGLGLRIVLRGDGVRSVLSDG